jgi:lipoate-protein ligase B
VFCSFFCKQQKRSNVALKNALDTKSTITEGSVSKILKPVARLLQILQAGATIERVKRGGELTFHGPGQLIAYPIYSLRSIGFGPKAFVKRLEDCIIAAVGSCGLQATGDPASSAGVCVQCCTNLMQPFGLLMCVTAHSHRCIKIIPDVLKTGLILAELNFV